MSLADAMNPNNLLCYEMNGAPLPQPNGFPLRLIAPGWYGIANVKWLTRIEVRDTRLMSRFMARDYVTIREEAQDGETVWVETSVGRALLKSAPAKVTRKDGQYRIHGCGLGSADRPSRGPDRWRTMATGNHRSQRAGGICMVHLVPGLEDPTPGEHAITSRAIATEGKMQPAPEDPRIAKKHTYWESNGQITRRVRI